MTKADPYDVFARILEGAEEMLREGRAVDDTPVGREPFLRRVPRRIRDVEGGGRTKKNTDKE